MSSNFGRLLSIGVLRNLWIFFEEWICLLTALSVLSNISGSRSRVQRFPPLPYARIFDRIQRIKDEIVILLKNSESKQTPYPAKYIYVAGLLKTLFSRREQ
jgi:hypothetical protein